MASRQDREENKIEERERSDLTLVPPDASASYLTIVLPDHGVIRHHSIENGSPSLPFDQSPILQHHRPLHLRRKLRRVRHDNESGAQLAIQLEH